MYLFIVWGRGSVFRIANRHGLDSTGFESRQWQYFLFFTRKDRFWGQPDILRNGYLYVAWFWPPITTWCRGWERVTTALALLSVCACMACHGVTFTFTYFCSVKQLPRNEWSIALNSVAFVKPNNDAVLYSCLGLYGRCLLFLSDFNQNSNLSTNLSENPKCGTSRNSVCWGLTCSVHVDRRDGASLSLFDICFANVHRNSQAQRQDESQKYQHWMFVFASLFLYKKGHSYSHKVTWPLPV
jgi:hypothetical protein